MIEVYQVRSDPDKYQSFWYQPQDEAKFNLFTSGERIGNLWQVPHVIFGDSSKNAHEVPDFPAFFGFHLLVASERAWTTIRQLVEDEVEALPIVHPSRGRYFAINVTRVLKCLLVEKCKTNCLPNDPSGYFSSVHKYAFDESVVKQANLFRCPEMKAFDVYASPRFKRLIEDKGLTGLRFKKIYPTADR